MTLRLQLELVQKEKNELEIELQKNMKTIQTYVNKEKETVTKLEGVPMLKDMVARHMSNVRSLRQHTIEC